MDHVLKVVIGSKMMSMLDGFLGYNQVEVLEKDQHKTTFTTPWGTFAYHRMPFGLINVGANSNVQRTWPFEVSLVSSL